MFDVASGNTGKLIEKNWGSTAPKLGIPFGSREICIFIKLNDEALGLYIPWNELINRTSLQWFVRLSPQQVLESDTIIGKQLLINN